MGTFVFEHDLRRMIVTTLWRRPGRLHGDAGDDRSFTSAICHQLRNRRSYAAQLTQLMPPMRALGGLVTRTSMKRQSSVVRSTYGVH